MELGWKERRAQRKLDKQAEKYLVSFRKYDTAQDLEGFDDRYSTSQQKIRDGQVTDLLETYVKDYKNKVVHSAVCRYLILVPCIVIIVDFAAILSVITINIFFSRCNIQIFQIVSFITACISFISLIVGLLTIVTKYFFPENDEQYISKIVELIQKNDLENKKENIRSSTPESTVQPNGTTQCEGDTQ